MEQLTNSLTPFVRHEMQNAPGEAAAPEEAGSLRSPPLGKQPTPKPNKSPQLMPPATPHPGPGAAPQAKQQSDTNKGIEGTAVACHQKNAADFLAGNTPGVMAYYAPGSPNFPNSSSGPKEAASARSTPPQAALPTQEDEETVERLVEWREDAPY